MVTSLFASIGFIFSLLSTFILGCYITYKVYTQSIEKVCKKRNIDFKEFLKDIVSEIKTK